MTSGNAKSTEEASAGQALWEAVEHVTEGLMRDIAGIDHKLAQQPEAIAGLVATGAHALAAISNAAQGKWEATADHANDMADAALNCVTRGYLGQFEATIDAAAATHRMLGEEAPTSSELRHQIAHKIGESLADRIYFATHPDAVPGSGQGPVHHSRSAPSPRSEERGSPAKSHSATSPRYSDLTGVASYAPDPATGGLGDAIGDPATGGLDYDPGVHGT
ncbi:hypothetical protein [Frankia sp. Cj3]|uniref:hypothetical protein n=1 Tax=Frankia sp. Cj3 TaxID=2880976 RepID=UPI001EF6F289|nr:hypothetical protein [Frankia sp. Cj3]